MTKNNFLQLKSQHSLVLSSDVTKPKTEKICTKPNIFKKKTNSGICTWHYGSKESAHDYALLNRRSHSFVAGLICNTSSEDKKSIATALLNSAISYTIPEPTTAITLKKTLEDHNTQKTIKDTVCNEIEQTIQKIKNILATKKYDLLMGVDTEYLVRIKSLNSSLPPSVTVTCKSQEKKSQLWIDNQNRCIVNLKKWREQLASND